MTRAISSLNCIAVVLSFLVRGTVVGFDLSIATNHLMNAYAAYCGADPLFEWQCYWCNTTLVNVTHVFQNSTTNIYGYVGIDLKLKNVVVAVRGTVRTSITNWVEDFDIVKTNPYSELPSLLVHQGFWDSYVSVADQIAAALTETVILCPDCVNTAYVGHSLGASIVVLAAVDTLYERKIQQPTPLVFTFGQPRIGNSDWVDLYNKYITSSNSNRVVHNRDPVPHLPLESLEYCHPPTEYWEIDVDTIKQCNVTNGEDPLCSDSVYIPYLSDHFIYLGYDHRLATPFQC